MPEKIAFLFPGQGSQLVGMGRELADDFQGVKDVFDQVDEICQRPISKLCFEGPMADLTLTENLQPAITAVNLACLKALNASGVNASISAGHSLGEYSALVSAGVVSEYDALRLVRKRGELMHREAQANPGGMAAVIGMDAEAAQDIVSQAKGGDILEIANYNAAEQIVITGENPPLSRAIQLVKERGGKAIPLKVSGAWHSKLMSGAVGDFKAFIEKIPFFAPQLTVLFNATAESETEPAAIKEIMATQLVSPVKWYNIMLKAAKEGVKAFVEVGPKQVLGGLLKKILGSENERQIYSVQDVQSLNSLLKVLA